MNETMNAPTCERENDLISFLYGEVNELEARDFERHLQICRLCQSEMASFGQVRESIGLWKEEALAGFVPPQVVAPVRKKSALAALREFFDLSPLWMKGAVGLAAVLFCVMVAFVLSKSLSQPTPVVAKNDAKYSEQQLQQALRDQAAQLAAANARKDQQELVQTTNAKKSQPNFTANKSTTVARVHRPLSKSEREQLAADLRLLSARDEDSLNLLGDRINQEF
jgi:anti-sigma factor RsiW